MVNTENMTLPELIQEAGRYASDEGKGSVFIPSSAIYARFSQSVSATYIRNTINRSRLFQERGLRASVRECSDDGNQGFKVNVSTRGAAKRIFNSADMAEAKAVGAGELRYSVTQALPSTYVNLDEFSDKDKPVAIKAIELFKVEVIRLLE